MSAEPDFTHPELAALFSDSAIQRDVIALCERSSAAKVIGFAMAYAERKKRQASEHASRMRAEWEAANRAAEQKGTQP